jgi:phosphatidylserine decarboxylase
MAKTLHDWIETDVRPFRDKPVAWLSQYHFFRDPVRPTYSDPGYFFSPADGVILYQRTVLPDECLVRIKGKAYSLKDALRDADYNAPSLVIGIFKTFFDVHINRIPFSRPAFLPRNRLIRFAGRFDRAAFRPVRFRDGSKGGRSRGGGD